MRWTRLHTQVITAYIAVVSVIFGGSVSILLLMTNTPKQSILPYVFVSWWWHGQYLSRFGSVVIHLPGLSTHALGRRVMGARQSPKQSYTHSLELQTGSFHVCHYYITFPNKAPFHVSFPSYDQYKSNLEERLSVQRDQSFQSFEYLLSFLDL